MIENKEKNIEGDNGLYKPAYPTLQQAWGIVGVIIVVTIGYGVLAGILQLALGDILKGALSFFNYVIPSFIVILIIRLWQKKNQ